MYVPKKLNKKVTIVIEKIGLLSLELEPKGIQGKAITKKIMDRINVITKLVKK